MTDQQIGWAVLELMGHRKLAGYVQEATLAGGSFLRIDVCVPDDRAETFEDDDTHYHDDDGAPLKRIATQLYSPGAVYCITPTTRDVCLGVALRNQPAPVARWELAAPASVDGDVADDDFDHDFDDELAPRGFE